MKTNVSIETDDDAREAIAYAIDSQGGVWPNQRKRKVTRAEIVAICRQHIGGLAGSMESKPEGAPNSPPPGSMYIADPEDIALMAQPKNPGYVYGWNKVKRGKS